MTVVGAEGIPAGITEVDDVDGEFPIGFTATALNVYPMPFVKPATTHEVAGSVAVQL